MVPEMWIVFLFTAYVFNKYSCMSVSEMENMRSTVFADYNKQLEPLLNQNDTVYVNVAVSVVSINDFDELSGIISLSLLLAFRWKEERISWNPADYGNRTSLLMKREDIWYPRVFILQASDRIEDIGNMIPLSIRIYNTGDTVWVVGKIVRATCSVDVTFFPYDIQTCKIEFATPYYTADELTYLAAFDKLDKEQYTENSEWELLDSSEVYSYVYQIGHLSFLRMNLKLERRVLFYVVYIFAPLAILSLLNVIVFGLPATSGERLSVAVTIFLSFVVYMNSVNQYIPESSQPMSILYYYLIYLIMYSSCIMFLCVASLRIYDKSGDVPPYVVMITSCLRFCNCTRKYQTNPNEKKPVMVNYEDEPARESEATEPQDSSKQQPVPAEMTWRMVGQTFDRYCTGVLLATHITFTTVAFHYLRNRKLF